MAADFIQNLVDKDVLKKVVENYKQRFRPPESARANKLCQETLLTYCIDNYTNPEHVCKQFNWSDLLGEHTYDEDSSDEEGESDQEEM